MAFPLMDLRRRFDQRRVKRTMTLQLTSQSWCLLSLMVRSSEVSKGRLHPFKRLRTLQQCVEPCLHRCDMLLMWLPASPTRPLSDDLAHVQRACTYLATANGVSLRATAGGSLLAGPPPGGGPPALAKAHVPETSPCTYLAAYWKTDMSYTPTADFLRWYMARVTCGPLVLATCRNCAVCPNLPEHLQIPPLRLVVQLRLPVLGAPGPQPVPNCLGPRSWRTCLN